MDAAEFEQLVDAARRAVAAGDHAGAVADLDAALALWCGTIAGDPDRVAALDPDLAALAARFDCGTGTTVLNWEYLLLTARRV